MEAEAVRLIRDAYEAVNEGRFSEWAAANELPPDFELVALPPISTRFVGPEGVAEFFADLAQAWETVRTDVEEVVELGDRVVVLGRVRNRGRGSEIELDVVAAHLWTVDGDVPGRVELIGDREEALRRGRAESSA